MITHEEARERTLYLHGKYDEAYKTLNNYISQQEKLQAEHEALKRDVARYFELIDSPMKNIHETSLEQKLSEYDEFIALKEKLSKVGKEER